MSECSAGEEEVASEDYGAMPVVMLVAGDVTVRTVPWRVLVENQTKSKALSPASFADGANDRDVFAMYDGELFGLGRLNRPTFVMRVNDDVFIYNSTGTLRDEGRTPGGKQPLAQFLREWEEGSYEMVLAEEYYEEGEKEAEAAPVEDDEVLTGGGVIAVGNRIAMAFNHPEVSWYGGLVVEVNDADALIAFDDGELKRFELSVLESDLKAGTLEHIDLQQEGSPSL